MKIVDLVTHQTVYLGLPTIYFGLPVMRSNGEYYSTSRAAEIAAKVVDDAERSVLDYYHRTGGRLDVVGMELYYRQKINEYMQAYAGTATLSPGNNINVSVFGTATYPWPIIGC